MSKSTLEDIIQGEVNKFLRGAGFLCYGEEVQVSLPIADIFMLPIRLTKEVEEERLVCTVL